jgi:hypothetical protein
LQELKKKAFNTFFTNFELSFFFSNDCCTLFFKLAFLRIFGQTNIQNRGAEERIQVCVRKRPRNKREIKNTDDDIVKAESTTTLTVNEPKSAVDLRAYTLQVNIIVAPLF